MKEKIINQMEFKDKRIDEKNQYKIQQYQQNRKKNQLKFSKQKVIQQIVKKTEMKEIK